MIWCAFIWWLIIYSCAQQIYYVGPIGNNTGPCSDAIPCSFSYALSNAQENSIIFVNSGTYALLSTININTSNIIIEGANERPIITGEESSNITFDNSLQIEIRNLIFSNFSYNLIFNSPTSNITISNCIFNSSNRTSITATASSLRIFQSLFNNTAGYSFVEFQGIPSSFVEIEGCNFTQRLAGNNITSCGAVRLIQTTAKISRSRFVDCQCENSKPDGFRIGYACDYLNSTSSCFIHGGGALMVLDSNITISESHFERNAAYFGGAIGSFLSKAIIYNSTFYHNIAYRSGGAIFNVGQFNAISPFEYSNFFMNNCIFKENESPVGSAIYLEHNSLVIYDSLYLNNKITGIEQGFIGVGALYTINTGSISIYNTSFVNNTETAFYGAGPISLSNCVFDSNTAQNTGSGAIFCPSGNLLILDSIFKYNKGTQGGAIRSSALYTNISNSIFLSNTAQLGGAISVANFDLGPFSTFSVCQIINSSFYNNYATENGGALYTPTSRLTIENTDFRDNSSPYSVSSTAYFGEQIICPHEINQRLCGNVSVSFSKLTRTGPPNVTFFIPPVPSCGELANFTQCNLYFFGNVSVIAQPTTIFIPSSTGEFVTSSTTDVTTLDQSNPQKNTLAIALTTGIIGAFILFIIAFVLYKRKAKKKRKLSFSEKELEERITTPDSPKLFQNIELSEIHASYIYDVEIGSEIGSGAFGTVYEGKWHGAKVAVKSLVNPNISELAREALTMKKLNHPNIVQFLGMYPEGEKMYMVTEFVDGGNLEVMLRNQPGFFSFSDLLRITMEVVSGMRLLEQKNVIHRDLAARNILIDISKQDFTAKVSDFGMSRDTQEYYTSNSNSMFPIKWASPEVIKFNKYSTKSDVWAMGVAMWEIFTFGEIPYIGMSNKEAAEYVCGGNRLSFPSYFSSQISQIIKYCWNEDPQFRPSFKEIYEQLEDLVLVDPSKEINKFTNNINNSNKKSDTTNSKSSKAYAYASPDVLCDSSREQSSNGSIRLPEEQEKSITYENLERETETERDVDNDTQRDNQNDTIDNFDDDEIPNTSFSIQDFPLLNNAQTTNTILTSINNSLFAFQNNNDQNTMK